MLWRSLGARQHVNVPRCMASSRTNNSSEIRSQQRGIRIATDVKSDQVRPHNTLSSEHSRLQFRTIDSKRLHTLTSASELAQMDAQCSRGMFASLSDMLNSVADSVTVNIYRSQSVWVSFQSSRVLGVVSKPGLICYTPGAGGAGCYLTHQPIVHHVTSPANQYAAQPGHKEGVKHLFITA